MDRAIISAAATSENEMMMSEHNGKSGAAFKRLTTDHGVQVRSFNDDVWDAMAEGADEVPKICARTLISLTEP